MSGVRQLVQHLERLVVTESRRQAGVCAGYLLTDSLSVSYFAAKCDRIFFPMEFLRCGRILRM